MPWEMNAYYGQSEKIELLRPKSKGNQLMSKSDSSLFLTQIISMTRDVVKQLMEDIKKANDMQGLYLYRNSRLIQYGGWYKMYGDTTEEHNKLGKILIDLPPEYSKQFGLNPTKSEIKLPLDFLEKSSNC